MHDGRAAAANGPDGTPPGSQPPAPPPPPDEGTGKIDNTYPDPLGKRMSGSPPAGGSDKPPSRLKGLIPDDSGSDTRKGREVAVPVGGRGDEAEEGSGKPVYGAGPEDSEARPGGSAPSTPEDARNAGGQGSKENQTGDENPAPVTAKPAAETPGAPSKPPEAPAAESGNESQAVTPGTTKSQPLLPSPKPGSQVLNLGSGNNPLEGATNVDIRAVPGVDVVTKPGAPLPFGKGHFDEVVIVNPAPVPGGTFDPLGLSAPVMKPGAKIYIIGQDSNYLLRQIKRMSDADLAKAGFKRVTPEGQSIIAVFRLLYHRNRNVQSILRSLRASPPTARISRHQPAHRASVHMLDAA